MGRKVITIFKPLLWEVKKAETGVRMQTSNQGDLFSHALSLSSAPWLQPPNPMVWTGSMPATFRLRVTALALSLPKIITLPPDSHGSLLHFLTFRSLSSDVFSVEPSPTTVPDGVPLPLIFFTLPYRFPAWMTLNIPTGWCGYNLVCLLTLECEFQEAQIDV